MTETSFSERVKALELPLDKLIVIGSGVLNALGIRQADDIDLAVAPDLFASFATDPVWQQSVANWGEIFYQKGDCEAWSGWTEPDSDHPVYEELLPDTVVIDEVRYMTLEYVRAWKLRKGRERDKADVALIDAYNKEYDRQ
jgi:hypothetical protein